MAVEVLPCPQSVKYWESLVILGDGAQAESRQIPGLCRAPERWVITKNRRKVARLTTYVTDLEQYSTMKVKALDYQIRG